MPTVKLSLGVLFSLCLISPQKCNCGSFQTVFDWNYLNFTWESTDQLESSTYQAGKDIIAGIKIYKDVVYFALPRFKKEARVTLAYLPLNGTKENPLLSPYPNWESNTGSSCVAFQDVLSMEIDKDGIMWVLDARRTTNYTDCPPKITLLDLNNNGEVLQSFTVPTELCPWDNGCFLNDLVIDGDYAYMSDTTSSDPGIFVYNRKSNTAWKFRDESMFADQDAVNFTVQGVQNTDLGNINGIALSCANENGEKTFYYMSQTSFYIYSISTTILKDPSLAPANISSDITNHGTKVAQSGGMIYDTDGNIYYGLLPLDAVGKWETSQPLSTSTIADQNHDLIRWPDTFAIYQNDLYVTVNNLLKFNKIGIDLDEINIRVLKLNTNTQSYINC